MDLRREVKMIRSILNLLRRIHGLVFFWLESRPPEVLLELEKENLRQQLSRFNQSLATQIAVRERLRTQIEELAAEEQDLHVRIEESLKTDDRAAVEAALRLQTVKGQMAEICAHFPRHEQAIENSIHSRDGAIQAVRAKIAALQKRLIAGTLHAATSTPSPGQPSCVSRVPLDLLDTSDLHLEATDHLLEAQQALADFTAKQAQAPDQNYPQGINDSTGKL